MCLEHFRYSTAEAIQTCHRCNLDNETPKLFCTENNMDPGLVPSQLHVSYKLHYLYANCATKMYTRADETHRDFRVRRAVVTLAIANNRYYSDVTIDHDTLRMLPIDGNLTNLSAVTVSSDEARLLEEHIDSDICNAHLPSTFVPSSA